MDGVRQPVGDLHGAEDRTAVIAHAAAVRCFRGAPFARFCGATPIPCGSGQTACHHRLYRGCNCQLNTALYRIAIVLGRHHSPAARTSPTTSPKTNTARSRPRAETNLAKRDTAASAPERKPPSAQPLTQESRPLHPWPCWSSRPILAMPAGGASTPAALAPALGS
jgi:Transposase IS116/IS110/IS902 family